ncbi:hypothetical protein cyc_08557, partial [Cyclospora cayetanensis]
MQQMLSSFVRERLEQRVVNLIEVHPAPLQACPTPALPSAAGTPPARSAAETAAADATAGVSAVDRHAEGRQLAPSEDDDAMA